MEATTMAQRGQKRGRNATWKMEMKRPVDLGGGGDGESAHEMHLISERERRKKMKDMFATLQTLLPQVPFKADKCTIVDETVNSIKSLEGTLQELEKQKQENLRITTMIDIGPAITIPVMQSTLPKTNEAFLVDHHKPLETNYLLTNDMPHQVSIPLPQDRVQFQTWFSPNVVLNMCGNDAYINLCSSRKLGLLVTIFDILAKHNLEVVYAQISSHEHHIMYMIYVKVGDSDQFPKAISAEEMFKLAAEEINLRLSTC